MSALFCDLFRVLRRDHAVPTIVIFTKYDKYITTAIRKGGKDIAHLDDKRRWKYGEAKASKAVEEKCIGPWKEKFGKVPLVVVSSAQSYLLMLIGWMTLYS